MTFDYEGARKEGYSDDEIADYLAKESKFDVAGARKEGYTSKEVIDFLSAKPVPEEKPSRGAGSFARDTVIDAAKMLIAPVQTITNAAHDALFGKGRTPSVKNFQTRNEADELPLLPGETVASPDLRGEAVRGVKQGYVGAKEITQGARTFHNSIDMDNVVRDLAAYDAIDKGAVLAPKRNGALPSDTLGRPLSIYANATPQDKTALREEAAARWAKSKNAVRESLDLMSAYADEQKALGKTVNFSEVNTRKDFATFVANSMGQGAVYLVPFMLASVVPGAAETLAAGMAVGDLSQERLKALPDPRQQSNPDRQLAAIEALPEQAATKMAANRGSTLGLAVPYAAAERLFGPDARIAKTLRGAPTPGGDKLGKIVADAGLDAIGEGVGEGAQQGVLIAGRAAADEAVPTFAAGVREVLDSAAAGAVGAAPMTVGSGALQAARGEPAVTPEERKAFAEVGTIRTPQVFQSPEAEAAGLPPLVIPPKSAAAVAAEAAKAGEKPAGATPGGPGVSAPQVAPKWAPEPLLASLDRAAAEVTAPAPGAAPVSIDGKSSENANVPAPAAAAGEPVGTAADTQAVAPEAAVRPVGDQPAAAPSTVPDTPVAGVPVSAGPAKSEQGAGLSSEVNAGVEATARMAGLLQNARRGFDQATAEYERTGQSPTYAKLRKHLMSNLLPLLGRKHAEAYTHWLTEEGGLGEGDFGMGSEYFDLAVQALAKRATAGAEPTAPAPAPIDLPESFASKSDASLFLSKNKLSDVRVVQAGNAWTIQPAARPDTAQEIAQNERRVVSLNEGLVKTGTTERAALVRDTGTEQGAITRAIGQIFGLPQVTVSGLASQAVYYKGVSYVSNKLDTAARVINGALHEAFHWAVQAHPDVAERYLDAVNPYLKTGVLEARQTFENKNKLPGEKDFPITAGRGDTFGKVNSAEEENAADLWGEMGGDPQLWVEMRQKDPGLFRAIRYRFLETLARAITALSRKGFKVNKLVTEYDKVRDATSTAMAEVAKRGKQAAAPTETAAPRAQEATEPDVRASKIDEDTVKREDGSRDYALNVERKERKVAKRGALTVEEQAAVEHDAATHGVDAAEWIAKAEKKKRNYPESAGWAPLRLLGLEVKETTNEDGEVEKEIDLKWQKQGYGFQTPPGKTKGPNKVDTRWAEQMAVRVAAEVRSVLKRAAAGDRNALIIVQHQTWYRNMAKALRLAFGGKGDFFADLLGATSPQTDVPANWRSAVDIIKRFSRGEFRREMKAALEWIDAGKDPRDMPGGDKIRKLSGKLYGINSPNAVRALLNLYRGIEPGSAPKAKNFAMNLIGESDMATIDVWAARLLRRMAQAIEKVGYERIAPPAEKGVTGKWSSDASQVGGEFGFGAVVMRLASSILKDEGVDVEAPDLQAIAWFIEKELWTKHNWTSKTGEGGSFEEQLDNTKPERLIVGWTIATGDHVPSDVEMSIAQARVMAVLRGDDTVLAARALPTTGMYAGDKERSFDTELVVGPGFDLAPLIAEIAYIAQEAKQYDVFVSKVLPDDMDAPNARPGVEVYFRGQKAFDDAKPILDEIVNNGLDGFTLVVDPRTEDSDAPGSEVGKYVGVRLQYIPEIEMRWSDPTSERYRVLSRGTPEELAALIEDKALEMTRAADKIRERADVAHSTVRWYDTIVIGKENYSDYTDGAQQEAPGQDGSRAWFGQPLGEVLARADSRLRGEQRQESDAGVRDGGDAGGQSEADVRRSKTDGPAEPPGGPGRSGVAGEQRDAGAAQAWSKRPAQPGSATVDGWHYGRERTGVLSGLYYGRGIKGEERDRVFADPDWRVQRRVYFYIPKNDGTLPAKEEGLGNHRYEQRLGNLYDGAVGDARVGPSSAADFETKVLDAGYDGYISRKLGMAVVLNADVPVNYTGIDQHGPARAEPPAQARLKKALLRGEIDAVDKALPALKAADPTLRARNGSVEYDPAARDALNAVPGEGLPRFSRAFKEWFGDSKVVDENGEPRVVYHGTRNDFEAFRITGEGAHFGNLEQAQERTPSGAIMPVYLAVAHPLRVPDLGVFGPRTLGPHLVSSGTLTASEMARVEQAGGRSKAWSVLRGILEGKGYDGLVYANENEGAGRADSWMVFRPEQIKSAIGNNGNFDPKDPDIRRAKSDALGFYSQLERVVENAPIKAAPAEQWKAWLNGNAAKLGVKADEIQWSGITDWLDLQKGKVTREAVSEYLANNGVQVEETVLGGKLSKGRAQALRPDVIAALRKNDNLGFDTPGEALSALINDFGENKDALSNWDFDSGETRNLVADFLKAYYEEAAAPPKYDSYVLPGGQNYRELLLTLPTRGAAAERKQRLSEIADEMADTTPARYAELFAERERLAREYTANSDVGFRSNHWDQPNVLAHIRFNERTDTTGARVMFVEEIQSDWGQEGKKKGFNVGTPAPAGWADTGNARSTGVIPAAPFVTKTEAWVALALKRAITYAVQNGFDKVAFTNGQQNADRYDLSKQVGSVAYSVVDEDAYNLRVRDLNDNKILSENGVGLARIEELVGKEIAQKVERREGTPVGIGATKAYELRGLDLKVGGEGMIAFYDKIVPQVARDVLKKIGGGQMTTVDIGVATDTSGFNPSHVWIMDENDRGVMSYRTRAEAERMLPHTQAMYPGKKLRIVEGAPEEKRSAQPGFDITPAMREKVAEGLPRFSRAPGSTYLFGLLEADELGNLRSRQTHKIRELGSRVLKPLAIKLRMNRAPESLRRAMREMEATVERAQRTAIAVAGEMREMTDVEAGVISDIVEQELQAGVIPPNELVDVAAKIGRAMSEQTDELLRLGMIDQAAADRWRGKYLPRFYESKLTKKIDPWLKAIMDAFHNRKPVLGVKGNHLRGRGKLERIMVEQLDDYRAQGWAIRDDGYDPATSTWVTVWRDYTRDEREQMGEIRDARFRFIMGYIATQKDIALGRLFERLADTDASDVAREGDVQVPRLLVPETGVMRYGKLAGKWVSQEIFNHISKYNDTAAYEDLLKIYRKAYGAWKESKTVLNPVAHANNVMGNVTMAHFAGVSYWDAHKYALAARDLMAKNSPMVEEARDHGLFLGTITQEEMLAALPEPLRVLAGMQENTGEKAVRHVWNALSWWLRRPAGAAYKWEDLFFRYLIYRDARTRGLGAEDAVDYAERFVFAYNDLPQGARIIRDTALPFFSWTYKAVPTMLSTALDYPWRYAAPAVVLSTINAAMYAIAFGDGDDDWWQRIGKYITDPEHRAKVNEHEAWERKNLPPWMKGASIMFGAKKTIRLGTDELTQHPVFLDVSRVLPAGDLLDTDSNAGGVPWFQSLTPNHPLFTTAFALFGNKDMWTGKEIVRRTKHGQDIETGSEKAGAYAGWLWRQFTPAIALGNYHFNRALNAAAQAAGTTIPGWPDDYTGVGRDGLPVQPKYAIEQTVGIKARPIDLSFSEMMEGLNKKEIISALEAEIRRTRSLAAKGIISAGAAEKEVKRTGEKLERVAKGLTVSGDEKE